MAVPGFGSEDVPATTGSIAPAVAIQQPLPDTLAYSDATRIGQAADAALWQAAEVAAGGATGDWINRTTGSSGRVESAATAGAAAEGCRDFSTIVTSIGGVHSYSGQICKAGSGPATVQLVSPQFPAPDALPAL